MITVHNKNMNLQKVRSIPLRTPDKAGPLWQGIPHSILIDTLISDIEKRGGWTVSNMKFATARNDADLVGAFDVTLPICHVEGMRLGLAFMSSNARRGGLRLFSGATVACCDNGIATGECVLQKRHTYALDLENSIEKAIDDYCISIRRVGMIKEYLIKHKLTEQEANNIILETGRQGLLPWSRLEQMDTEYHKPPCREHGEGTAWTMLQSFASTVKRQPTHTQLDRILGFRKMLPHLVPTLGA